MKATARLVALYFFGTPLARWLNGIGGALVIVALCLTHWVASSARDLQASGIGSTVARTLNAYAGLGILLVAAGVCALFLGTTLMPTMLARQSMARQMSVLPHGASKLLASATLTVLLVAIPSALALPLLISVFVPKIAFAELFGRTYVLACLNLTLLYLAYWIASTRRTPGGRLAGAMIIVGIILGPGGGRFLLDPSASIVAPTLGLIVLWLAIALLQLNAKRLRAWATRCAVSFERALRVRGPLAEDRRLAMVLGTARPWTLALVQIVPAIIAARFVQSAGMWLFFFVLFSALSGAFSSTAAARARSLWLRTPWSRIDLFRRAERSFLSHNGYALGVLAVLFVATGTYLDLPTALLAHGLLLLFLGSAVSTYLGLMMTRRMRWSDIALAVVAMGMLMSASLLATREPLPHSWLAAAEFALALTTASFRAIAVRRWMTLDWMECRRGPSSGFAQA